MKNQNADRSRSPIAIIAGNGQLPIEVATQLQAKGDDVFVLGIVGEASENITDFEHEWIEWEKVGKLFRVLKACRAKQLVLVGGVSARPALRFSKLDFGALMTLPGVLAAMLGGDNTLLSTVASNFESRGFEVCSLAQLLPELLVKPGRNSGPKPSAGDLERVKEGVKVTKLLGTLDIGQGCVVVGKRAIAVEGIEGTDEMLVRVKSLRELGRLPKKRSGVLVKGLKPNQDERVDLPTIGPETVANAKAAGLTGIGVEAGKTLIVEKGRTFRTADECGVFVYGFEQGNQV